MIPEQEGFCMSEHDYMEQIRKEYPNIRPSEEDDMEWFNDGFRLLHDDRLDQAEAIFKKLSLAQPDHSDGFHGLAMVYAKKGHAERADFFLQEALRRAERFVKEGSMDREAMEMIKTEVDELLAR
jgi:tetratricopeptide (TPR) repeat protein